MQGSLREDRLEYPIEVVRELVVNALMHRDYSPMSRGTQVQVELFADRLVVRSPGGLYGPVDPDDFGAPDVSSSRNALLAKLLSETRLSDSSLFVAENRGSGIPTIMRSLNAAGMSPPRFNVTLRKVEVTVPHHALLTDEALDWVTSLGQGGLTPPQLQALAVLRTGASVRNQTLQGWGVHPADATKELTNLVARGLARKVGDRRGASYVLADAHASPDTDQTPPKRPISPDPDRSVPAVAINRTSRQQQILALLDHETPVKAAEITEALGCSYSAIIKDLNALIESGNVRATAPARSRRRAYRLTNPA